MNENKSFDDHQFDGYQKGIAVIVLLAVLTAAEFLISSVAFTWWAPLVAIGLVKAFFVMRDYMHIGRVFATEEEEHA